MTGGNSLVGLVCVVAMFVFFTLSSCSGGGDAPDVQDDTWTNIRGADYYEYMEFTNDAGEHCTVVDGRRGTGLSCTPGATQ